MTLDIEFRAIGPPIPYEKPKQIRKRKTRKGRPIGSKNKTDIRWTDEWKQRWKERKRTKMVQKGNCDYCFKPLIGVHGTDYYDWEDNEDGLHVECYKLLVAQIDEPTIPADEVLKQINNGEDDGQE